MIRKLTVYLFFAVGLIAEELAVWDQFARTGLSNDNEQNGGHAFYRVKRTTDNTFHDLRIFGYGLEKDSYAYMRYKSSVKYTPQGKLYHFTTVSYQKNTRAELDLRYHFNQGFGYFINQYKMGHIHTELGHAYDMSDYLNDTRKTSYIKSGIFWDHDHNRFSIKLDTELFKQISDIVSTDQSRVQLFTELAYHFNKTWSIIVGYEQDQYLEQGEDPRSYFISLGWNN